MVTLAAFFLQFFAIFLISQKKIVPFKNGWIFNLRF